MFKSKIICGLKFKFKPYNNDNEKRYIERWVCETDHFNIEVRKQSAISDYDALIISKYQGGVSGKGINDTEALKNALDKMNNEVEKSKRIAALCGIGHWNKELADARSRKLSCFAKLFIRS